MTAIYFAPSNNDFEVIYDRELFDYNTTNDLPILLPVDRFNHFKLVGQLCLNVATIQFAGIRMYKNGAAQNVRGLYSQYSQVGGFSALSTGIVSTANILPAGTTGMGTESVVSFDLTLSDSEALPYGYQQLKGDHPFNYYMNTVAFYIGRSLVQPLAYNIDEIRFRTNLYNWFYPSNVSVYAWGKK